MDGRKKETRMDEIPNLEVRQECSVIDIVMFLKARKETWNNHVSRAEGTRLIKICVDRKPTTGALEDDHRSVGLTAERYH